MGPPHTCHVRVRIKPPFLRWREEEQSKGCLSAPQAPPGKRAGAVNNPLNLPPHLYHCTWSATSPPLAQFPARQWGWHQLPSAQPRFGPEFPGHGFSSICVPGLLDFESTSLESAIVSLSWSVMPQNIPWWAESSTPWVCAPLTPPFSSDTSLTHSLLFQTEKKTESWQGGLPPVLQWAGRSPPWGPVRPCNPDNSRRNHGGSVNLAVTSAWGPVPD